MRSGGLFSTRSRPSRRASGPSSRFRSRPSMRARSRKRWTRLAADERARMSSWRAPLADGIGTALLLAAVVGSGIMGERLADGNDAVALLANSIATGLALFALIVAFAPRSGAHFNPLVTLVLAMRGQFPKARIGPYVAAQFLGALAGVLLAHAMFDLPLLQVSPRERASAGQWLSEAVATFGLVFVVLSCEGRPRWAAPAAIGSYIGAAYWFTAS